MKNATKKYVYLGVWLTLGGLCGFLLTELTELFMVSQNEVFENRFEWYGVLILLGIGVAAILGPVAWRKIYVEGARGKKYIVK
jgi:hypothetical protein